MKSLKNITCKLKIRKVIIYNFSSLMSLIFSPDKFILLKGYQVIMFTASIIFIIVMLSISN